MVSVLIIEKLMFNSAGQTLPVVSIAIPFLGLTEFM